MPLLLLALQRPKLAKQFCEAKGIMLGKGSYARAPFTAVEVATCGAHADFASPHQSATISVFTWGAAPRRGVASQGFDAIVRKHLAFAIDEDTDSAISRCRED